MARASSVRVSKLLSLMLRHRPDEFGVEVDAHGFADLQAVLAALRERDPEIEMGDIEALVQSPEKQRFEIVQGRIRARYGHSFPMELGIEPSEPPDYLYKGVEAAAVESVLASGLRPLDRQYVHLSFDRDVAARLATRAAWRGAVIRVDARRAHQAGVLFYDCGPTVLVKEVPAEYLAVEQVATASGPAGADAPSSAEESQGPVTFGRKRRFSQRR